MKFTKFIQIQPNFKNSLKLSTDMTRHVKTKPYSKLNEDTMVIGQLRKSVYEGEEEPTVL